MPNVFRFAPSPNGYLHLGHAYCALLNARLTIENSGTLLLRLEDIDAARCTRGFADAIEEDLAWLGLTWQRPIRHQSDHLADYSAAQERLRQARLLYPCFCTRGDVSRTIADQPDWPRDPDGVPLYPGTCRRLSETERRARLATEPAAWRLDMTEAVARTGRLAWNEEGDGPMHEIGADPLAWGDVILARKDIGTSYHVAVVVDDALQGVTHVVRGRDLFAGTSVHRVLQTLLRLPAPNYHHHTLLRDEVGAKLAKSKLSTPLQQMRAEGMGARGIRHSLGFD